MALQYDDAVRNAKLDAIQKSIGPAPTLKVWEGKRPKKCSDGDVGRLLAVLSLPSVWMGPAFEGVKAKRGEWSASAQGSGSPGYFRIYSQDGRCRLQGSVGSEMALSASILAAGQKFTVVTFKIRDNNA